MSYRCYCDNERDERFMREALMLARQAAGEGEVPVGAVVVRGDEIIGRGTNRRENGADSTAHAEIEAIREACASVKSWRLSGCELYVTLEPCPMCAGAIINSRIERVVFGADDKKAGSVGSVINMFELPYNHRPYISRGVCEAECAQVLTEFFERLRSDEQGVDSDE